MTELEVLKTEVKQPRKRKNPTLWQTYLWYSELLELRKRHILRISAIERGVSDMDAGFEQQWIDDIKLDHWKNQLGKTLANTGSEIGPVWQWLTSIRGLKNGLLTAQLVAQIDDIGRFDNISKLWRFCGYAVFDGKAEKNKRGEKAHFNGRLKGILFNIAETFLRMQTPGYVDIYYHWKLEYRKKHPVAVCKECDIACNIKHKTVKGKKVEVYTCPNNSKHKKDFSDSHIHYRAIRKMMKAFLKDLWLAWREYEGLPVTQEWQGKDSEVWNVCTRKTRHLSEEFAQMVIRQMKSTHTGNGELDRLNAYHCPYCKSWHIGKR